MPEIAVSYQQVTKRYGGKIALDQFSVAVPEGRVVGVLGANGAGKSTWFRTLMGLAKPDAGQIMVLGQAPGWQVNANVAYLPDRARWYPRDTVSDAFWWAQSVWPGFNRSRAEELARLMDLDLGMRASNMSRGGEVRLMVTLCLARQVPLMVLDEPFSGIDIMARQAIINILINYMADNRHGTVLMSTHEIYEAETLFDYVVCLRRGRTILAGDADELRGRFGSLHNMMHELYQTEGA